MPSDAPSDPLLPVPNRTESFWLSERDPVLAHARTTDTLPSTADVVVVGSGLTGAMMAYHIYQAAERAGQKRPEVVMLEADEACGSATARNGGHCKPVPFIGYRAAAAQHDEHVANHLHTFEQEALQQYVDIVLKEDIDCDLHVTRAVDVCFMEDDAEAAKLDYEARRARWPEDVQRWDVRRIDDRGELERLSGIKGGKWGASYPAGHLWPYKLALALIRIALDKGMNLQTHTPALCIQRTSDPIRSWTVHTTRGPVSARSVVVATNAYTSSLLPAFQPLIVPVRGTVCSITPSASHSAGGLPGPLRYSLGLRHGPGQVDYMIPRQGRGRVPGQGDKSIILGGAKGVYLKELGEWYDNKWDDRLIPGTEAYFQGYMRRYFAGWDGEEGTGGVHKVWTGVLGYSSDLLPYVGEVPDMSGVFICAGFTGHGMPRIPGCTAALAPLVIDHLHNGETTDAATERFQSAIPKPYWMTPERYASRQNLIKGAMGQGAQTAVNEGEPSDERDMLQLATGLKEAKVSA